MLSRFCCLAVAFGEFMPRRIAALAAVGLSCSAARFPDSFAAYEDIACRISAPVCLSGLRHAVQPLKLSLRKSAPAIQAVMALNPQADALLGT